MGADADADWAMNGGSVVASVYRMPVLRIG